MLYISKFFKKTSSLIGYILILNISTSAMAFNINCSKDDINYLDQTTIGKQCHLDKKEKKIYNRLTQIYLNCSDNPSYTSGCYESCLNLRISRTLGLKKINCKYNAS